MKPEPARIKEFHAMKSRRIEPVALDYLWPQKMDVRLTC